MARKSKKTSMAASSAVAAVTAAGVLVGGAFASPDDILNDGPDAIVQTLDSGTPIEIDSGGADGGAEEEEGEEETKRSLTGSVRRLVLSAPVGVRAVVAVPLWALGTAVIALASSLWSAVLSPVASTVLSWLAFAALAVLIFALAVKTVFPDLPLKKILNKRSILTIVLLCFLFGVVDCVLPFFWEDYENLSRLLKLVGSLICTGVPVGFFVRRRRRKLKKQAEEDAARAAEAAEREAEVYELTYEEREAAAKELVAELADSVCPKVY